MSAAENKVVLFADILGFAALTKLHPLDLANLRAHERPFSLIGSPKNALSDAFCSFHNVVSGTLGRARWYHSLTAITFSDSAFVATTHLHEAVNIASDIVRQLIAQRTPIRVGIAFGSFAALRFKSDITAEGGEHATEFLGTAVVHAAEAEKCGIKGMRILLHPSVMPLLEDPLHNPPKPVKSIPMATDSFMKQVLGTDTIDEFFKLNRDVENPIRILKCPENASAIKAGVQHEIDYWHLPITQEASAWKGLQDMWAKAPASESNHYEATADAISRMRISQGRTPIDKLRRRTLPK